MQSPENSPSGSLLKGFRTLPTLDLKTGDAPGSSGRDGLGRLGPPCRGRHQARGLPSTEGPGVTL